MAIDNLATADREFSKFREGVTGPAIAVTDESATAKYKFSDKDDASDPMYFGYVDEDQNWYILRFNDSSGTGRYVKGTGNYLTAWTDRASQTYDYYYNVF